MEELELALKEGKYNIGVRLGEPSKLTNGRYLGAIDCDVKSKSRKALREMNEKLRELGVDLGEAPIVTSGRGNGSKHVYVQTEKPLKPGRFAKSERQVKVLMPGEKKEFSKAERKTLTDDERNQGYRLRAAWEISLMGTGQQTVLPPSVHPDTGFKYAWASPLQVKRLPVFKPRAVVRDVSPESDQDSTGDAEFKPEKVDLYETRLPLYLVRAIESGEGCEDRSATLFSAAMAMCRVGLTDNQILSVLSDPEHWLAEAGYEHTGSRSRTRAVGWLRKYTLTKARYETHPMRRFENRPSMVKLTPQETVKVARELKADRDWRLDLQKTKEGVCKVSLTNTELILSNAVGERVFVHDDFSTRDSYGCKTPWGGQKGDQMNDVDVIKIRRWLSGSGFKIEPGKDMTLDAVKLIAARNHTHPVREWLKSLEWDGTPRLGGWIKKYLKGDAPEPYLSEVSKLILLAMVKRVFEPGCQWDYTLVLEGNQGTFKSTTARILAGDAWFLDNLPDLRDKDVMLNLQGKWLIELAELADVKRGDHSAVKAYMNRRVDRVRSPYDRLHQDIPRQSVFIGTVNEGQYLKDPTGNRRFWPIKVGICNVEGLKKVREQLFAEAMWTYENCFDGKLMLSSVANDQAREAQDDRRVSDDSTDMEDALAEFMADPKSRNFGWDRFKMKDLFVKGFAPWSEWDGKPYSTQRGAEVLHRMGFKRIKIMGQRIWKRKAWHQGGRAHYGGTRGRLSAPSEAN